MENTILEMKKIRKEFPGVLALNDVDFDLRSGEVHFLIGENGAGKSTLMKVLSGSYRQDSGQVIVNGEEMTVNSPVYALQHGIAMIYQELNPIPYMTVAENIYVGREPKKGMFLDRLKLYRDAQEILDRLGIDISPRAVMKDLSVAETQMIEIAKAVSYNSRIVIMDEPTSAITDREVEKLFSFIKLLKEHGVGIVYISHKMEELARIADRVTVMRDGEVVGCYRIEDVTTDQIITLMVGREIENVYPKRTPNIGEVVFKVENLSKAGLFRNVSFELRKGEILGISGLMGAGRTETVETIFGIRKADSGRYWLNGKEITLKRPKDAIRNGFSLISEDRKNVGLNLIGSVRDNISVLKLDELSHFGFVDKRKEMQIVRKWAEALRVKTPSYDQLVKFLSGGNQQKVVIAKWLTLSPEVIIMDEPTRGIDVGAKSEIYDIIADLAAQGKAIIMISSELPEIIGMCDRTIIMHEGDITGELNRSEFSQEAIMRFAIGVEEEEVKHG